MSQTLSVPNREGKKREKKNRKINYDIYKGKNKKKGSN